MMSSYYTRLRREKGDEVLRRWPNESIRDIARDLDVTVSFVTLVGIKAGHASRAPSVVPGAPPRKNYQPRRNPA